MKFTKPTTRLVKQSHYWATRYKTSYIGRTFPTIAAITPTTTTTFKLPHTRSISLPHVQSRTMASDSNAKSEQEWRAVLSPEQFRILRQKGTEAPGTGEYDSHYKEGVYGCAGCGTPLYKSDTKFKSGCGWPAFFDAIPGAVNRHEDRTYGMTRIEITCAACGGHLGHVFKGEGFPTPTDERHCVNSVSLKFQS